MNIAEIRERIQKNCGRNYDDFNNQIDSWCNNTVKERLMLLYDLWFMDYAETIPTVSGTRSYSLPTSFKNARQDGIVYRDSNNDTAVLDILTEPDAHKYWGDDDTGPPEAIVIQESTYDVWPKPDDAYNIDWDCSNFLTDLSDSNTTNYISNNFPDVYIGAGTYKGFLFLEEYERAAIWEGVMNQSIDLLLAYNVNRRLGKVKLSFSPNAKAYYKNSRSDQ